VPPGVSDVIVKHVMTKVKEIGDPAAAIGFIAHDELYPQQQIILHNGMLYGFVRFNLQPNGHRDTEQEAQVWMHEYLDALNVPISAEDEKQISLLTSANLPNEGTECILEGVKLLAKVPRDENSLVHCLLYELGLEINTSAIYSVREWLAQWLEENPNFITYDKWSLVTGSKMLIV